jgi:hypothetical protein
MNARCVLLTLLVTCATVGILTPSVAQAANTTCVNADYVFLGERAAYGIAASGSLFFKTRVTAGRSYAVLAWGPFQDAGEGGVFLSVDLWGDSTCTTPASGLNSSDYEPLVGAVDGHIGDHDNIIPTADGTIYVRVTNSVASAYTVHVLIIETTLFSPWWFTGGTNQAYIEVSNSMTGATTAEVTLRRSNGTVCGTTSVLLAGGGNAAIEINNVGTCAAALSGSAQIAFAGTPGGLAANITTINVPNGTSFDSPFTPRMVWGTFSR